MMVKPGVSYRGNKLDDTLYHPEETERLVKDAIAKIQPPSLHMMECEATRKRPKLKPRVKLARRKLVKKAKPEKAKTSAKTPTIPVEVDEQRHALWWDFKKDRTFMSVPYPIQPKDRAEGIQKTLNAQRQRATQSRLRACGTTPSCDRGPTNEDWCVGAPVGSVCHEAKPEFAAVVDSNMDYYKELSNRSSTEAVNQRSVDTSIVFTIRDLREREPIPAAFNSTLVTVKRSMQLINDAVEYLAVEQEITALEKQISTPAYPSRHERAEDKYWKEKLEELGLSVVAPSGTIAVNDSDFNMVESQYEKDKWTTPKERLELMRESIKHEPWMSNSEVQYYLALKKFDDPWYCNTPVFNIGIIRDVHEIDGIEYGEFLRTRCGKQGREVVELARTMVDPEYEMDLGKCVHPLEQTNLAAFHNMSLQQESRRIAMFDYGVLDNAPFEQLSRKWTHLRSIPLIDYDTIEFLVNQRNKEALAEKIINQRLNQMPFKLWTQSKEKQWLIPVLRDVVEDTTQEKLPTTDSEVSPTPQTDAIFNKWHDETSGKEVVSNVVDLKLVRDKHAEDVQKLINGFKGIDFSQFTPQQEEGARMLIMMLNEALG